MFDAYIPGAWYECTTEKDETEDDIRMNYMYAAVSKISKKSTGD